MVYFIMDLNDKGLNAHQFVYSLEEIVIRTLDEFSIAGTEIVIIRVWVNSEKICSLGIRVVRGVLNMVLL